MPSPRSRTLLQRLSRWIRFSLRVYKRAVKRKLTDEELLELQLW